MVRNGRLNVEDLDMQLDTIVDTSSHELGWMDNLSNHYSEALERKRRRLLTAEETAQLRVKN